MGEFTFVNITGPSFNTVNTISPSISSISTSAFSNPDLVEFSVTGTNLLPADGVTVGVFLKAKLTGEKVEGNLKMAAT